MIEDVDSVTSSKTGGDTAASSVEPLDECRAGSITELEELSCSAIGLSLLPSEACSCWLLCDESFGCSDCRLLVKFGFFLASSKVVSSEESCPSNDLPKPD